MSIGVALVTGGAQGLGRGITGALLKEGYKVSLSTTDTGLSFNLTIAEWGLF